jgi:triacylglycerol lipase
VDLLITRVPATASIKDRAAILAEAIEKKYAGREVNLIGHSMVRHLKLWAAGAKMDNDT